MPQVRNPRRDKKCTSASRSSEPFGKRRTRRGRDADDRAGLLGGRPARKGGRVVCDERSRRRPGRGVARAPWTARNAGCLPQANKPARVHSVAGDRCSGPERREKRAQPRRGVAGERWGTGVLIDRCCSEIGEPIRGGPEARPPARTRPKAAAAAVTGAFPL